MSKISVTTIKPTSGLFVSFTPRNEKGTAEADKKPECHASYSLPESFSLIQNPEIAGYLARSYKHYVYESLKAAVKINADSFSLAPVSEIYPETTGRTFTVTKGDLESWFDSFASAILTAAISSKLALPADSVKVVKKVIEYRKLTLALASKGNPMAQDDLDAVIRFLGLIAASGKEHSYTDNVAQGAAKMQHKIDGFVEPEEDIIGDDDF